MPELGNFSLPLPFETFFASVSHAQFSVCSAPSIFSGCCWLKVENFSQRWVQERRAPAPAGRAFPRREGWRNEGRGLPRGPFWIELVVPPEQFMCLLTQLLWVPSAPKHCIRTSRSLTGVRPPLGCFPSWSTSELLCWVTSSMARALNPGVLTQPVGSHLGIRFSIQMIL